MEYKRAYITSDGDGHNYIIPFEEVNEFNRLLALGERWDDYAEFEEKFSKYRTGGDLNNIELYTKID